MAAQRIYLTAKIGCAQSDALLRPSKTPAWTLLSYLSSLGKKTTTHIWRLCSRQRSQKGSPRLKTYREPAFTWIHRTTVMNARARLAANPQFSPRYPSSSRLAKFLDTELRSISRSRTFSIGGSRSSSSYERRRIEIKNLWTEKDLVTPVQFWTDWPKTTLNYVCWR